MQNGNYHRVFNPTVSYKIKPQCLVNCSKTIRPPSSRQILLHACGLTRKRNKMPPVKAKREAGVLRINPSVVVATVTVTVTGKSVLLFCCFRNTLRNLCLTNKAHCQDSCSTILHKSVLPARPREREATGRATAIVGH